MFLKNRNISSKIKRSKVTDYAALSILSLLPNIFINAYARMLDSIYHMTFNYLEIAFNDPGTM